MRAVRTIVGILLVVLLVVVGYWLYITYTTKSGDDEIWAAINRNMPDPLRKWSCTEVRDRAGSVPAPRGCADVWAAMERPAAMPETEGAPGVEAETQPRGSSSADPLDSEGMGTMEEQPGTGGTGR